MNRLFILGGLLAIALVLPNCGANIDETETALDRQTGLASGTPAAVASNPRGRGQAVSLDQFDEAARTVYNALQTSDEVPGFRRGEDITSPNQSNTRVYLSLQHPVAVVIGANLDPRPGYNADPRNRMILEVSWCNVGRAAYRNTQRVVFENDRDLIPEARAYNCSLLER